MLRHSVIFSVVQQAITATPTEQAAMQAAVTPVTAVKDLFVPTVAVNVWAAT